MSWHLNPWEKVDKKSLLKMLEEVKSLIKHYERYYPYVYKHIVPKKLHEAVSNLSSAIGKCENYYAYYQDIRAIYVALEELKNPEIQPDALKSAKAYGKLFLALAVLAAKIPNPAAKMYARVLQGFGENFERIVANFMPATMTDPEYKNVWDNPNETRY